MYCAYHPTNNAASRCTCCSRFLCPACDHRIKGYAYCQDCIVAGIESLGRNGYAAGGSGGYTPGKSPVTAMLLGLIPGLGAAYNGQNVKALVQFLVTIGLWTLADIFNSSLELTFALGGTGVYFYTVYDSYASAQRHRAGEDLQAEDERLKEFLRKRTNIWGGIMILIGVLSILNYLIPYQLYQFWPALLILAGAYLLRGFRKGRDEQPHGMQYRAGPPPSVITSGFERPTAEFGKPDTRYENRA